MAVRTRWVVPVVTAVVLGVLLGGVLYGVHPLRLTASGASTSTPTVASTHTTSTPRATASPRVPDGPAFTQRALLQSSDFLEAKWAKSDELSLTTGVSAEPIVRCLRPDRVTGSPVAAYAATHHGRTTLAGEQVVRYSSVSEAKGVFDRLAGEVGDGCADLSAARRASVGKPHQPDLAGISQTRWWKLRGTTDHDPLRGVLVLIRVEDRLMLLCLTSDSTDPAKTTDIIPLMRQGGLRLV